MAIDHCPGIGFPGFFYDVKSRRVAGAVKIRKVRRRSAMLRAVADQRAPIKMPAQGGQKSLQGKSRDMSGNPPKEFPTFCDWQRVTRST
jgi:hypothetical protein